MMLRFLHGWGLDARMWDRLAALLPEFKTAQVDRDYFDRAPTPSPTSERAELLVTHSFGTLLALRDPPPGCRGLVAINGFDRFTAGDDAPGIAPRIVERMLARFAEDPAAVVADFRKRCGDEEPFGDLALDRLRDDLAALRDWDCRAQAAELALPILSLQGGADPILPSAMRDAVFAGAALVERVTQPEGGHLLPLTDPAFCAAHIRRFAERLA